MHVLILILITWLGAAARSGTLLPDEELTDSARNLAPITDAKTFDDTRAQYIVDVIRSLARSDSPRDWAIYSQMVATRNRPPNEVIARFSGIYLRRAAEGAPQDRMVQAFWANASPELSGCDQQHPCPNRVSSWAKLEPNNGAACFRPSTRHGPRIILWKRNPSLPEWRRQRATTIRLWKRSRHGRKCTGAVSGRFPQVRCLTTRLRFRPPHMRSATPARFRIQGSDHFE